jgi:hypothetical protein
VKDLGGRFARYHGRLYKSNATSGTDKVPLLAYGDTAPEPGFEPVKAGLWRKWVSRDEVSELYKVEYRCTYRGLDCTAAREDDDGRVELLYLIGNSYAAKDAGFEEIDRGVFRIWVSRNDLPDLHEVRRPAG